MKKLNIFLILILLLKYSLGAIDPAPPYVSFFIDNTIKQDVAYIILIDSLREFDNLSDTRKYIIKDDNDKYTFRNYKPFETFTLHVKFKDSTEKFIRNINVESRHKHFEISFDKQNDLVVSDVTWETNWKRRFWFIVFITIFMIVIRVLPSILIVFLKQSVISLSKYILLQLTYFVIFGLIIWLFGSVGFLLGYIAYVLSLIYDKKRLNSFFKEEKVKRKVRLSITLSTVLILLCFIPLIFIYVVTVGY